METTDISLSPERLDEVVQGLNYADSIGYARPSASACAPHPLSSSWCVHPISIQFVRIFIPWVIAHQLQRELNPPAEKSGALSGLRRSDPT
jgi:hypothetical protein